MFDEYIDDDEDDDGEDDDEDRCRKQQNCTDTTISGTIAWHDLAKMATAMVGGTMRSQPTLRRSVSLP